MAQRDWLEMVLRLWGTQQRMDGKHTMITLTECPVCGGNAFLPATKALNSIGLEYYEHPSVVIVEYVRCSRCLVVFQNPRMSEKALMDWYASGEYRRITGSPESADVDEQERALRIASYGPTPHAHLDIGSSRGFLLKEMGAAVQVGVEWNESYNQNPAASIMKDIPEDGEFDLITMIHSLEHVIDPRGVLALLYERLSDNGELWVEVPSLESRGGPFRLAHTFFFEVSPLVFLASQSGFTMVTYKQTPHLFMVFRKENSHDNLS